MSAENQNKPTTSAEVETELSRSLGLVSALAIGIGTMVAAGIFTLSGLAVGYVGSAAIVAFLAAAVVATFTALTYCEFTSIYPESGEGYLYARRTFSAPLAYIVGWCLLLGYMSSCAFYIASLSSYFNEFIWHAPLQIGAGLVALAALTLLNIKGTKESGTFQIVVTAGKIVLLIWFVVGGMMHLDTEMVVERFSTDVMAIGSTAALVFITFFGFSAIAASAGEVRDPTRTIPRAIFISMGVVTLLYSAVVLVVVVADLNEYTEAAMGVAAKAFLGPIGGMVIVGGALFSMISASNASILAGSRVALSMSRRGHLPQELGTINRQTRTPISALMLVGIGIALFASLLPLEQLANFANCVLLTALIFVNAALIQHRRRFPHLKRPFRVPLVPLLPALGIVANVYLLTQIPDLEPILLAASAVLVGLLAFLAWKGTQAELETVPGERSHVALERRVGPEGRFRVIVPIANPATVEQLVSLAAAIAKPMEGELVLLRVVLVPEQISPSAEHAQVEREQEILDLARHKAIELDVPTTSLVRVGHDAARAILETARERHADLIVIGWKGQASKTRHILGEVTDVVVNNARTDIMLAKLVGDETPKNLLLPTAGGDHAIRAEEFAGYLAKAQGGSLTLCTVLEPDASDEWRISETERLNAARDRVMESTELTEVSVEMIQHRDVSEGIVAAGQNHDAIVVGAAGQSFSRQVLFGSIPEEIARDSERTVIVVKRHRSVKALLGRVMSE